MRVTSRPKIIRILGMPKVPNTIYAIDLHRATHISAGNQTPCFVQFRVKLVRFMEQACHTYLPLSKVMTVSNLHFQYYNKR